jgi:hypothetical protein
MGLVDSELETQLADRQAKIEASEPRTKSFMGK